MYTQMKSRARSSSGVVLFFENREDPSCERRRGAPLCAKKQFLSGCVCEAETASWREFEYRDPISTWKEFDRMSSNCAASFVTE